MHLANFGTKTVAMMRGFADLDAAALHAIAVPVLVREGDRDVITPAHEVKLARKVPDGELAIFPACEHGACIGAAESPRPGARRLEHGIATIETFLGE